MFILCTSGIFASSGRVRFHKRIIDVFADRIHFRTVSLASRRWYPQVLSFALSLLLSVFLPDTSRRETDENAPVSLSTGSPERNTILDRCLTWINVFTIWRRCARMLGTPQKIETSPWSDSAGGAREGRWRRAVRLPRGRGCRRWRERVSLGSR